MRESSALVLALVLASGCAGDVDLSVDLRTDMVPGVEFNAVRTRLEDGTTDDRAVLGSDPYIDGQRVAEFFGLPPGPRAVRVQLIGPTGEVAAERLVRLDHQSDFGLTVVVTRDCANVVCPGPGDDPSLEACIGGVCADASCSELDPASCPAAECTVDTDCTATVACAVGRCAEGVCVFEGDGATCAADEYCHPEMGCTASGAIGPITFLAGTQDGDLFEIDPVARTTTHIADLADGTFAGQVLPGTRQYLYWSRGTSGRLRSYDLDSGTDTVVGDMPLMNLDDLTRIDFDASGRMWVMTNDTADLYVLDPEAADFPANPTYLGSWVGVIDWGGDLVFDADGTLYISDRGGGFHVFEDVGEPPSLPMMPTRTAMTEGLTDGFTGMVFDATGTLWATDFGSTIFHVDVVTGAATPIFDVGAPVNDLSLSVE